MSETRYMPRLQRRYIETTRSALQEQFGYTNPMQVPKLEKVVVNACVGSSADVKAALEEAKKEMATITRPLSS